MFYHSWGFVFLLSCLSITFPIVKRPKLGGIGVFMFSFWLVYCKKNEDIIIINKKLKPVKLRVSGHVCTREPGNVSWEKHQLADPLFMGFGITQTHTHTQQSKQLQCANTRKTNSNRCRLITHPHKPHNPGVWLRFWLALQHTLRLGFPRETAAALDTFITV